MKRKKPLAKYHTHHRRVTIISLLFILLFLGSAALIIYSLIKQDMNTTFLGLGIMCFFLIFGSIVFIRGRKPRKKEKERVKPKLIVPRKGKYPVILFVFFILIGIAGSVYFYFFKKDFQFLIASVSIFVLSVIGISIILIKNKRVRIKLRRGKKEKKVKGELKGEVKAEHIETRKRISKAGILRLQRIVKHKIEEIGRDKTQLDVLYWLLEQEKQIKFTNIARIFNIKIKKVEEWAQILEVHGFAEMYYPAFGSPLLKFKKNIS